LILRQKVLWKRSFWKVKQL